MILIVTVPDARTFDAYNYGWGEVLNVAPVTLSNGQEWLRYTVAFESRYHAECQEARFASGLYFSRFAEEGV